MKNEYQFTAKFPLHHNVTLSVVKEGNQLVHRENYMLTEEEAKKKLLRIANDKIFDAVEYLDAAHSIETKMEFHVDDAYYGMLIIE